ncbi:aryl-sulfate sulfotransferase [candidate division KSB1 bacterium]|nr:aryl-sulfate sulfotransferase [candidate division KSB1 bacterium]
MKIKIKVIILLLLTLLSSYTFAGTYHPVIDYIFPLPDSKLLPVHATVILKLDETYNSQITDLSSFISVEGEDGFYTGHVFFAADERTIIFKPDEAFQMNEIIDVIIQTSQFSSTEDFIFTFQTAASSANELEGPLKNAVQSNLKKSTAFSSPRIINGVAVPSDFPRISTNQYGETAPGRIFFASTSIQNGYGNYIVICDNDGTPYFYRRYPDIPRTGNLTVHPNGELSFHCYETYYIILDRNFVEVDTIWAGHEYYSDDHELQILENGHILQVARDHVRIDMSKVVNGGRTNAVVEAHHLQEMDEDYNVIFEWRNWDHLDIRDTYVGLTGNFIDFVHMNSIAIDYDGHFIISPREYKMIMKIHRTTGETIWKLGGRDSDFELINEDLIFSFQHDARPVPGQPNHYTIFDNGRDRYPQFSRGVEYELDLDMMTAEKVWEYRHDPDWYSGWMGSVQRFTNGNSLIDWPSSGMRTIEVNSDGDIVWEMFVTGTNSYRSCRYEWEGQMLRPYLILENLGTAVRLIFNKFGDPNVDYYRIYRGDDENNLAFLDSTTQTYFDIDALELGDGTRHYFGMTAVSENGTESDFSNLESTDIRVLAPGENAIRNGGFQSEESWELRKSANANASGMVNSDGFYEITITNGGSDFDDVQLWQSNILVMQNQDYSFKFDAYASIGRVISAKIESEDANHINYGRIGNSYLSNQLNPYTYNFTMNYPTDTKARVVFNCGGQADDVYIDNVSLIYTDENSLIPLSAPWSSQDIGLPQLAGQSGMRDNRLVIRGSGNDIWNQADELHFAYQTVEGDAEIIARIHSLEITDPWAKVGVMMRNSLQSSSKHVMMILSAENGTAFQRRIQDGESSFNTGGTSATTPHWVRLIREGNLYTGYESSDGEHWEYVGSETVDMQEEIFIGLPVTSHNDNFICEAELDHIQLSATSDTSEKGNLAPASFMLHAVYPNPFNPKTTVRFEVPIHTDILIEVYDITGRKVCTLVKGQTLPGTHQVVWNGNNESGETVGSGLYFIRMQANMFDVTQKVTLLR